MLVCYTGLPTTAASDCSSYGVCLLCRALALLTMVSPNLLCPCHDNQGCRMRRARLTAARRPMRPAVTPAQWLALAPLLALHAMVVWRICFVSYGWPALLFSPGLAWTAPLLAWLLWAGRRAVLASRRLSMSSASPVSPRGGWPPSPRTWPAALLPEVPLGSAKNR